MSSRIVFVNSLLVLFSFIVVVPPASGLSCYVKDCLYSPYQGDPDCRDRGLVDCLEEEGGGCGTLSFTLGSNYRIKIWNCTRTTSTHDDCNVQTTCDRMRELVRDFDDTIESCSVTCCHSDGCNDSGKKKNTLVKLASKKKDMAVKNIRQTFYWPQ